MAQTIFYQPGTVRWRKHTRDCDVRTCGRKGWEVEAHLIDRHPLTDKPLPRSEWWLRETKED